MSRLSKLLFGFVLILFVLACNFITQPIRDAQNLAETAQALGSAIPIETLQALPSLIPEETLQALPSAVPTLEALASALPDFGNMFNPQGTPVTVWNEIPIMPQATSGQEFPESNTYSFKATATAQEAQDFYNAQLTSLGWNSTFNVPVENTGGLLVFQKDDKILTITISTMETEVVVILTLA